MLTKYIEAFEECKNKIDPIDSYTSLEAWKGAVINIIIRTYGKNSRQEDQINNIIYRSALYVSTGVTRAGGGDNLGSCKKRAIELVESFIKDLRIFGLPRIENNEGEKNNEVNITLNQVQSQKQMINLNIIFEALQEELTGKQLKEIREIVDSNKDIEEKKRNVIDKLKSFGEGLTSNIIANILTNPNLYM